MVNGFLSKVWPEQCVLCAMDTGGTPVCAGCEEDLRWSVEVCRGCSLPLPSGWDGTRCGKCLVQPPKFSACVSACCYQYPLDRLIAKFKYGGQESMARALGTLLSNRLRLLFAHQVLLRPELIIPVPLHRKRMVQRGFNQAYSLAQVIGNNLAVPVSNKYCVRQRETREQTGLSEAERHRNMRGAFALRAVPAGKTFAIVDDVITTASTVHELAQVLLRGGARSVQCWSVARTVS